MEESRTVTTAVERAGIAKLIDDTISHVGVEVAAREAGEDASFFMAAMFAFPFAQETWCYTISSSTNGAITLLTTVDVLVCLFCFSLTIEHVLSVMGIMAIERKGIEVTHHYYQPSIELAAGLTLLMMLLAAGEA